MHLADQYHNGLAYGHHASDQRVFSRHKETKEAEEARQGGWAWETMLALTLIRPSLSSQSLCNLTLRTVIAERPALGGFLDNPWILF